MPLDDEKQIKLNAIAPYIQRKDWDGAIGLIKLWAISESEKNTQGIDGRELLELLRQTYNP